MERARMTLAVPRRRISAGITFLVPFFLAPALAGEVLAQRAAALVADSPAAAAARITPELVREHIHFLASDEMRGRDTPSPELDKAAAYIAEHFDAMGLEPAGDDGSWFQRWPYERRGLDAARVRLRFQGPGGAAELRHGQDYAALPGREGDVSGAPVFVGTAARAAEGLSHAVHDQVALIALTGQLDQRWERDLMAARDAAAEAGARAVAFIAEPGISDGLMQRLARAWADVRWHVGSAADVPAFLVRGEVAGRLFRAADQDLDALRARAAAGAIEPVAFRGTTADLRAPILMDVAATPPNVVGMIRGSDPVLRDSYVIYSAHIDHVGVGAPDASGDTIYNGADDNASGTTALMEVARAFASLAEPPARSIIFLGVSGEEKGLLGSLYFTDHPTIDIDNAVANINLDMVGRNHPDSIYVIGKEFSSLGPLVREVAGRHPDLGLVPAPDPMPEQRLFFRSDQFSFARLEIPVLFFFSGLHEDYHRPSDTPDKIDFDKLSRVARLAFLTGYEVAVRDEAPQWTEDGLAQVRAWVGR